MFLLRTEAGLSATDAGRVLGRSGSTVLDLSRLVAHGQRGGDLVASTRHVLDLRSSGRERPSPGWMPHALPGLRRCRLAAGLSQHELAGRARVARETLCKIERGRPATQETVRRLAAALAVPPDVLGGTVMRPGGEPKPQFPKPASTWTAPSAPGVEAGQLMDGPDVEGHTTEPTRAGTNLRGSRTSGRLPGLRKWRMVARVTQEELARRSGLARETLIRIENQQRGARPQTIRLLADALLVAPSMLTGSSGMDASIHQPLRTCTDCGGLRPARAFLPIAGTPYVYGCCRMCRNRRKRERYYSTPDILAAERARSRRYKQLRKLRAVSDSNAAVVPSS